MSREGRVPEIREADKKPCPTCGIWLHYLKVAHPNNLPIINGCKDSFHDPYRKEPRA